MSASSQNSDIRSETATRHPGGAARSALTGCWIVFALLCSALASADTLDDEARYSFVVDSQQTLQTPLQALQALQQQPPPRRANERDSLFVTRGLLDYPVWFLTPVPAGTEFVTISGGWQDYYRIAFTSGGEIIASYPGGPTVPAAERPVQDPRSVFRLPSDREDLMLLVHHQATGAGVDYPIEFQSDSEYRRGAVLLHLRHGTYYGLVLLVLCFSLGAAISNRQSTSAYFSLYLVSTATLLSCQNGFLGYYVLQNSPTLLLALTHISLGFVLFGALMFGVHFLQFDTVAPRSARGMRLLAAGLLVHGLINSVLQTKLGSIVEMSSSTVAGVVLIYAAMVASRHRIPGARAYLLSRLPTVIATLAIIANNWALQSITVMLDALLFAAALEMLILSIALSLRLAAELRESAAARDRERELGERINHLQLVTDEAQQLRSVQHSVQEAHRVRTINQMAGGVAHDFNNIFTSVIGFAELLKEPTLNLSEEQRRKFGAEIFTAGERGAQLVEQLLIYSRSAKPNAAPNDVAAITAEALRLARPGLPKGITLEVALPHTPLQCVLDANQWRQVVINLVANAGEAMNEAGTISVTLEKAMIPSLHCSSCLHAFSGERIMLTVRDEGSGIDGPVGDLFTPFHTTKSIGNGSGLGLSVVDGIVHEHGGHLVMTNRSRGSGVRVEVALPCSSTHRATTEQRTQLLLVSHGSEAVIATQHKLQRYYQVTVVQQASTAIATFQDNSARFGLVAIEVLRDNEEWLDIASAVRRTGPGTPILFLTTDVQASTILKQAGALQQSQTTAVLNLHDDFESLLASIESLLKPGDAEPHNVNSLRDALRRLQRQSS